MIQTNKTALVLKKSKEKGVGLEMFGVGGKKESYFTPVIVIRLLLFRVDDAGVFWIIHPGYQHIVVPTDCTDVEV